MNQQLRVVAALAFASCLCTGCATFLNDDTQPVSFSSDPQGAIVAVDGAPMGRTPCTVPIARKGWDKHILFSLDGYKPVEFTLKNTMSGAVAGNLLIGGLVGGVVDGISGRGGGYQESVQVVLVPLAATDQSRVVDVDFKLPDSAKPNPSEPTPAQAERSPPPTPEAPRQDPGAPTQSQSISIEDLVPGEGPAATVGNVVDFQYSCHLLDGTLIFDTRAADGKSRARIAGGTTLPVGLCQALVGTRAGMVRRATIPPELGYGSRGSPRSKIPPNAVLVYEITVVSIGPAPAE